MSDYTDGACRKNEEVKRVSLHAACDDYRKKVGCSDNIKHCGSCEKFEPDEGEKKDGER